jgi:spermidine/putrescine transport system permease protein
MKRLGTALRHLVRDPQGRPRWLALMTWLYVLWSLVPVLIAIQFSFNAGKSRSAWQGFSFRWYWEDPTESVWNDEQLRVALKNSLMLAALTILIAVPLGTLLAIGLARWRGRTSRASNWLMLFPLVTPEIVMGVALLLVFTNLYTGVPRGFPTQLLGHVTFTVSFVVIIVRGRLLSIGNQYEEAARDLGASAFNAFRLALLPLLWPAIFAASVVVFATSIDDFVISSFLSTDASNETVPMKIYSSARGASTPALNALATIVLLFTLGALTLGFLALRAVRRRSGGGAASSVRDLAAFEV